MPRKNKKILIVDDEPNIVLAISYLLIDEGYEVHSCYHGEIAKTKALELVPDLIILDVMMPDVDGYEVAKYVRMQAELNNTTIIFLTAKGTSKDKLEGYDSGAEAYIVKPFDNQDLLLKIEEAFSFFS